RVHGAGLRGGSTAPAAAPRRRSPLRAVVCGGGRLRGEVGGALEHLERLLLAAGAAQELAPRAVGLDVVAPVPLLLEQRGRLPEGVVRAVGVARQRERFGQGPERVAPFVRILDPHGLERGACPAQRFLAVAKLNR